MFDAIDKTAHVEIIDNPDVREFLSKCRYMVEPSGKEAKEVAELEDKTEESKDASEDADK